MKLTRSDLTSIIGPDATNQQNIDLSGRGITEIESLSYCRNLRKLNLSNNSFQSPEALSGISRSSLLTLLNLSKNQLSDLDCIDDLKLLLVLNLAHNKFKAIPNSIQKLPTLKALILNDNQITQIENIDKIKALNTLVISQNKISEIPNINHLKQLTKLSAAHNKLTTFPEMFDLEGMKELRLNDNQISQIPEAIANLKRLSILDLGNNQLKSLDELSPLKKLEFLRDLNVRGNPLCLQENFHSIIRKMFPNVRILNGENYSGKVADKRAKRKEQATQAQAKKVKFDDGATENIVEENMDA